MRWCRDRKRPDSIVSIIDMEYTSVVSIESRGQGSLVAATLEDWFSICVQQYPLVGGSGFGQLLGALGDSVQIRAFFDGEMLVYG